MSDMLEAIKALLETAMLALLVVFFLPITLVLLSLWTSSWIPIVLGLGIAIFSAVTIIKKRQKQEAVGDDNKIFNPILQEKAIEYLVAAREKKEEETRE